MKQETKKIDFNELKEQLIQFYEVDTDNCNMTNIDWITEIAKLMTNHEHKLLISDVERLRKLIDSVLDREDYDDF